MAETNLLKKVRTFMIFVIWATKGMYLEIAGPTMIDLKLLFNTNYASVTRSVAGRGVGGFFGAVIGAFLVDKYEFNLDLSIGISSTLAAACLSAIPFVPDIDYVWLLFFAIGCLSCIVNMAGTRLVLKMWKEKSASMLSFLHMGFGVGALIAPIICSPFLATLSAVPDVAQQGNQKYDVIQESRVAHAYLLIGVFILMASIPFYLFQCKSDAYQSKTSDNKPSIPVKTRTFKEMLNPATYADGNFKLGLYMLIILFIYYFNLIGGEKTIASFVRTISVDVFHFQKGQASMLNTGFWLSLTVGRLASAVVAHYVPVQTLFPAQVLLHLGSAALIYLYGMSRAWLFVGLTLLEGFVISPLYPQGVAYGNTQIDMTGVSLMVIVWAGAFGDIVYLWSAGGVYDHQGPQSILMLTVLAAAAMAVCVILFRGVAGKRKHVFPSAIPNFSDRSDGICSHIGRLFYR